MATKNGDILNIKPNENVPFGFYGKIIRTEDVVRSGVKGILVWDALIFNEITFQENITHKKHHYTPAGRIMKLGMFLNGLSKSLKRMKALKKLSFIRKAQSNHRQMKSSSISIY